VRVLVVNAGSSSLKLTLLDGDDNVLGASTLNGEGDAIDESALRDALAAGLADADAVGHRIVHGGERFAGPVRLDTGTEAALRELSDLAPLHQAKSLAALDAVSAQLPERPAVACFDTAFHATLSAAAATYALPRAWRQHAHLRRYGFHGLSHAWVARRAAALLSDRQGPLRIVSCHLGAGASLCAIADGCSVDTTMGFTPLEGLVMSTRSGSVDPGLLLWLLEHHALTPHEVAHGLEHDAGLLGLAGSADMRTVLDRRGSGDPDATLALDVYLHRLRGGIAAMAATLGGLDVLAFTGGVGEASAPVRAGAADALGFLGVDIDPAANHASVPDRDISTARAPVRTLVIAAREDLQMAREVRQLLTPGRPPARAAPRR